VKSVAKILNCEVDTNVSHARGFSREPGQDHRYNHHRDPQYPAFRPFFRIAGLRLLRFLALVSLFVCLHSPVLAQQTVDEDEVIRVNTDLLLFPVRVRDKKGQAVPGLTEQDLLLKDQDQVTTGLYFSPGADRVALMFALDQSGSLRQVISQQREAALALFSKFGERSSVAINSLCARRSSLWPRLISRLLSLTQPQRQSKRLKTCLVFGPNVASLS
jgi:hypothetical protein